MLHIGYFSQTNRQLHRLGSRVAKGSLFYRPADKQTDLQSSTVWQRFYLFNYRCAWGDGQRSNYNHRPPAARSPLPAHTWIHWYPSSSKYNPTKPCLTAVTALAPSAHCRVQTRHIAQPFSRHRQFALCNWDRESWQVCGGPMGYRVAVCCTTSRTFHVGLRRRHPPTRACL